MARPWHSSPRTVSLARSSTTAHQQGPGTSQQRGTGRSYPRKGRGPFKSSPHSNIISNEAAPRFLRQHSATDGTVPTLLRRGYLLKRMAPALRMTNAGMLSAERHGTSAPQRVLSVERRGIGASQKMLSVSGRKTVT
ncbi:hypothetical protein NDU88_010785 [Pleurodeles waltl]|uniref:Uncharacterized protein n=1 Tax=Pleurodeles waltl TaxID=8319 RepID=A0AAV7PYX8_PLEWA|nr:hypothetical protein NDU88_010785 [Pleurodeles waltl]